MSAAEATQMQQQTSQFDPQQHGMQLMLDPTDGPPSWEAGLDPYGGLSPIYGYQRGAELGGSTHGTALLPQFPQYQPYAHTDGQNKEHGQVATQQTAER
jgi:hypothetical protein